MLKKKLKKIIGERKLLSEKDTPKAEANRRKILFETMESRVLLSADLGIDPQESQVDPDLLPDLVPILEERDGQFVESEIKAADDVEIGAGSTSENEEVQDRQSTADAAVDATDKGGIQAADFQDTSDSQQTAPDTTQNNYASDAQDTSKPQQTILDDTVDLTEDEDNPEIFWRTGIYFAGDP